MLENPTDLIDQLHIDMMGFQSPVHNTFQKIQNVQPSPKRQKLRDPREVVVKKPYAPSKKTLEMFSAPHVFKQNVIDYYRAHDKAKETEN